MIKKAVWVSLILSLTFGLWSNFAIFAQSLGGNETITITTYYPSPFGIYKEMRARRIAIGDNYIDGSNFSWESFPPTIDSDSDLIVEGNVGIGTNKPQAQLDIVGGAKIGKFNEVCDNTKVGTIRWFNADKELQCCNGTDWKSIVFQPPATCSTGDEIHGGTYDCHTGIYGNNITEGCKWCQCDVSAGPDKGVWACTYYCSPVGCPATVPW